MQIQDEQQDSFIEQQLSDAEGESTVSQVLEQLFQAKSKQCYQIISRLGCEEQLYQSFRSNWLGLNSVIYLLLSDQLNSKIAEVLKYLITETKEQKFTKASTQQVKRLKNFFKFLKTICYKEKQLVASNEVVQLLLQFTQTIDEMNIFYFSLDILNSILSKNPENHEKFAVRILGKVATFYKKGQIPENFGVSKLLPKLDEQLKLLLNFQVIRCLTSTKISSLQPEEAEIEEVVQSLRTKPYKKLFSHSVKFQKIHEYCDRIIDQILSCTIQSKTQKSPPVYCFRGNYLHQKLLTKQSILLALKQTGPEYLRFLNNQSFLVVQNTIYSKYDMKMLEIMQKKAKTENQLFEIDIIYAIGDNFRKLVDNNGKILRVVGTENQMQTEENLYPEFLSKIFSIMTQYMHNYISQINSISMQGILTESIYEQFLSSVLKWLDQERIAKSEYIRDLISNIIVFSIYLSFRRSFQNVLRWDSATSNLIVQLIEKVPSLNRSWTMVRNMKSLLNRWIETLPNEDNRYRNLIAKFFEILFDPKVNLPVKGLNLFSTMKLSKANNSIIAEETINQASKLLIQLEANERKMNHALTKEAERNIQKILMLTNFKSKINVDKTGNLLGKLYEGFAHLIPSIYHYRSYITDIYKKSEERDMLRIKKIEAFFYSAKQLKEVCHEFDLNVWIHPSREIKHEKGKQIAENMLHFGQLAVNYLEIKNSSQQLPEKVYSGVIEFLKWISEVIFKVQSQILVEIQKKPEVIRKVFFQNTVKSQNSLYHSCQQLLVNFKNTIRFYLCNSDKALSKKEQYYLAKEIGQKLYLKIQKISEMSQMTFSDQFKQNIQLVSLINDLFGTEKLTHKSHIQKEQVQFLNNHRELRDLTTPMRKEQWISLNIISSFYSSSKNYENFFEIIKNILDLKRGIKNVKDFDDFKFMYELDYSSEINLIDFTDFISQKNKEGKSTETEKEKEKKRNKGLCQKRIDDILNIFVFPIIQTSPGAWLNDQNCNSSEDEIAIGLLYSQISEMQNRLLAKDIIELEQQFDRFVDSLVAKRFMIKKSEQQQADMNNPFRRRMSQGIRRDRANQQQIRQELLNMRYPPEMVDVVLENNTFTQTGEALEWIGQNEHRIDQLMIDAIEKKTQNYNKSNKKSEQYSGGKVAPMKMASFTESFEKNMKSLIKNVLLPNIFSEYGQAVKNMLFVSLGAFQKNDFKSKQYVFFAEKMFNCLNQVKMAESEEEKSKLKIILGILDSGINKQPKIIMKFLSSKIGSKLLTFLPNLDQESGELVLKIVNNTLPLVDAALGTDNMQGVKKYMHFICDALLDCQIKSVNQSEILYKIAIVKDQQLFQKVLKVICIALKNGSLKNNLYALLSLLLESDSQFTEANMELDIKGFILETYGYKDINQEVKQPLIEIDTRIFGQALRKYDGKEQFKEVFKKFFIKKKNKNRFIYYNYKQHDLLFNETLNVKPIEMKIPEKIRLIMDMMIQLITQKKDHEKLNEEEVKQQNLQHRYFVKELQKLLDYYRLLIPYICTRKIDDGKNRTDFISWLINIEVIESQGIALHLVEFLMMNNNLFINASKNQKVEVTPFAEFVVANVISNLALSNNKIENDTYLNKFWTTFTTIYLSQVKSFSQKALFPYSQENKTSLGTVLENSLSKITLNNDKQWKEGSKFESNPIAFALRSECLYLIHKWKMIKTLSVNKKYKIVEGGQTEREKQYLPMDLFYGNEITNQWRSANSRDGPLSGRAGGNRIILMRDGQLRFGINPGENMDDEEYDEGQEQEGNYYVDMNRSNRHANLNNYSNDFAESQRNIFSIMHPIQSPQQPPQNQQSQINNSNPVEANQVVQQEARMEPNQPCQQMQPENQQRENNQQESVVEDQSQQQRVPALQPEESEMQDESQEIQRKPKEEEIKPEKEIKQKKEQESIQEFIELPTSFLKDILEQFSSLLPEYDGLYLPQKKQNLLEIPELPINIQNVPNCKQPIADFMGSTEFTSSKTKIFHDRISQIYKLLYINKSWEIPGEKDKKKLTLRLSDALMGDRLRELGGQMMMQIERLLSRRQMEEETIQNRSRPLNIGEMMGRLEEYIEPVIQQPVQPVVQIPGEQKANEQQPKQKNQAQGEKMEIQSGKKEEKQIQKKQEKVQNMQIEESQEKGQIQEEKPEIKQNVEEKQQKPQGVSSQQKKQQNVKKQKIDEEKPREQNNEQKLKEEKIEEQKPQNEKIDEQKPQERLLQEQNPQERPQVQRQVLNMLGLPQNFLQQAGIDQQLFDTLPEDVQMQQITSLMRDQQRMRPQNTEANQGNNPPPVNDNAAFYASLDPTLRQQLLLEATPEVLATLPPEMRAEAQNIRQRQISRLIEEQEQYQEENMLNGSHRTEIKNLKFPDVPKQMFPKVSETLPQKLIKTVFITISTSKNSNFKIMGYRFLLENKQTRDKALTTLLSILRQQHFGHQQKLIDCVAQEPKQKETLKNSALTKWVFEERQISKDIKKFRENILKLIFESIKTSPYRDEKFLQNKISCEGFGSYKVQNLPFQQQSTINEYDPQLELLDLGISYQQSLAVQIMKRLKDSNKSDLPSYLLDKIVSAIKRDKLPIDFYDHLENISDNTEMKKLFQKHFPETSPPKIELLANILKYKFAQLPYLKNIHEQAISSYNPNYNEFLNQVFSIYQHNDLKKMEPFLLKYKNVHFQIIKHLYSQGRSLENEPIGIILKFPNLLDFETKKFLFRRHPKIRKAQGRYRLAVQVSRENIFQDSYNQIMGRTPRQLMGRINVTFIDEPGYDAGGIAREWFECLSREIFNPDYALFEPSSSGNTYQPNPKSYVNPDHLQYFKFIGRFVGKALAEGMLIDSYFTRACYKIILGQELEFDDLQQQDYPFYKSMLWLKENKIEGIIDETFSYQYDAFGSMITKDIIPGGKTIPVTQENKLEYVSKYCLSRMRDNFSAQMNSLLEGFHDVIPQQCISFFEAKQLELLISGMPSIDIEDMKTNTDYSGYTPADQVIQWYWEIVESYSQDQLAKLVQFITGTSRIPAGGFSQLQGMNGLQRISIHKDPNSHQLPKAHTCFNQLDLPNYHSKQIVKERLRIAITQGHEGFGFM